MLLRENFEIQHFPFSPSLGPASAVSVTNDWRWLWFMLTVTAFKRKWSWYWAVAEFTLLSISIEWITTHDISINLAYEITTSQTHVHEKCKNMQYFMTKHHRILTTRWYFCLCGMVFHINRTTCMLCICPCFGNGTMEYPPKYIYIKIKCFLRPRYLTLNMNGLIFA